MSGNLFNDPRIIQWLVFHQAYYSFSFFDLNGISCFLGNLIRKPFLYNNPSSTFFIYSAVNEKVHIFPLENELYNAIRIWSC